VNYPLSTAIEKIVLCAVISLILGCVPPVTPHENFVYNLNRLVGKKVTYLREHHAFPREDQVSTVELPNGHLKMVEEVKMSYRVHGVCRTIYEVDPLTDTIVRVDFEGTEDTEKNCVVFP
jgi:hypothetical protein